MGASEFSFLGIEFNVDMEKMIETNYTTAMNKIDKLLTGWSKRRLTPLGKIAVIKSLAVSKLNHLIMTCPIGKNSYIKQLESKFYHFLWEGKPDKIKRANITQTYVQGGLKMINLENFVKAMKCTWIRRLITGDCKQWITLFQTQCCPIKNIYNLGPQGVISLVSKSKNTFWSEVFESWEFIYSSLPIKGKDAPLTPIWKNSKVKRVFLKKIGTKMV